MECVSDCCGGTVVSVQPSELLAKEIVQVVGQ
jgi:hypothetical protein